MHVKLHHNDEGYWGIKSCALDSAIQNIHASHALGFPEAETCMQIPVSDR